MREEGYNICIQWSANSVRLLMPGVRRKPGDGIFESKPSILNSKLPEGK